MQLHELESQHMFKQFFLLIISRFSLQFPVMKAIRCRILLCGVLGCPLRTDCEVHHHYGLVANVLCCLSSGMDVDLLCFEALIPLDILGCGALCFVGLYRVGSKTMSMCSLSGPSGFEPS